MAAEVRLFAGQVQKLLTARDEPVVAFITRKSIEAENAAKLRCPVNTGRLRSSITHELRTEGGVPVGVIGTNVEYARFVHDGTGIYGPHHTRIVPKTAKALVFKWPKAPIAPNGRGRFKGLFVFASVKGSPGRPFLRQGLEDAFRTGV